MGYAEIVSGGEDGLYTIRIDSGEAQRIALTAAYEQKIVLIDENIVEVQTAVTAHDALVAASVANLTAILDEIVASQQAGDFGLSELAQRVYAQALQEQATLIGQGEPNRTALQKLRVARAEALRNIARFNTLQTLETRSAWCADFTEGAAGFVATIEIPGEPSSVLVAPTCRAPALATDGQLRARDLMSPEQCYFNAAILPGWQRHLPTFREGTLTFINWEGNFGNVTLGAALSSAQGLNVNDRTSLLGVDFEYMQTNCRAFDNDSRVVIDLLLGWEAPKIIGFFDNPRPDPPTFYGPIGDGVYLEDEAVSFNLSSYWLYGNGERTFSLEAGTLPAGLSLNTSTGVVSGAPTTAGVSSGIVVRCADSLYNEAKNRRYDDSNAFSMTVYGGWNFFTPISMDLMSATDTEYIYFYLTTDILDEDFGGYVEGDGRVRTEIEALDIPRAQADIEQWVEGAHLVGFPSLWYRATYTGDAAWEQSESTQLPNVWYPGLPILEWNYVKVIDGVGTYSGTYTIQIATDEDGTNVVCQISGSLEATLVDP